MRDWQSFNKRQRLWKLAAPAVWALGLAAVVAVCFFCFALLAIWIGLPGE